MRGAPICLVLMAALCFCPTLPCEAESPRLAVMDLRAGEGVSSAEARTLTGILRTAMHDTGAFTLINREDMEQIAQNHRIELVFCDDDACLLKVGNLLGAERLVAGEVGLMLGEYVINARLVDITSSALVNQRVATQRSEPSASALEQAMGELALVLAGLVPPGSAQETEESGLGYDGSIFAQEGERLWVNRGRKDGVRPGRQYEVYPPIGAADSTSPGAAPRTATPRAIGRIEIVEARQNHSIARWRSSSLPGPSTAIYPLRRMRPSRRLTLEACFEYCSSLRDVSIDFIEAVGDPIVGSAQHHTRVSIGGPSFGVALLAAVTDRFSLGLRADGIVDGVIRDSYAVGPTAARKDLPGSYTVSTPGGEEMGRLGVVLRMRVLSGRKLDVGLEADAGTVFWDSAFLDATGLRAPGALASGRLRLHYQMGDRLGLSLSSGYRASLGGDWSLSAITSGLGVDFGL